MENIATLQAVVVGDITDFERAMADVRNEGSNTMNFLSGVGDLGKNLTLGLTVPLVGAAAAISKIGMEFDANMRNINSLTQLGEEQFRSFSDEVNRFGSSTIYGSNKTAEALYNIVSAGIGIDDTAKAMELLSNTTRLASSGRDDLDRTTAAMIALMGTYGKVGYSAEQLANITAQMVQSGVGEMNTYTQNLAKALPAAINLGIGYEELAGSIAVLSQTYGNGSKPMTAIGMLTSNLMKPTTGLAAAYEELGVATGTDLINKFGGLMGALEALKGSMSQADFQKSFSKTGFEAVLLLTNNIADTNKQLDIFKSKIDGSVDRALTQQMMSVSAAFDKMKATAEGVAIVLSTRLLPLLTPIFNGISSVGQAFMDADPALQTAVVVIGAIAAAAGPVLWAFSAIVGSITPMGIALKAAIAGAVLFRDDFAKIATTVKDTVDKAVTALKPLTDAIGVFWATLYPESAKSDYGSGLVKGVEGILGIADKIKLPNTGDMITVDKPTALWDIYVKNGYDKAFSWDEFKKEALDGGWKGGKAYLNPGEHIFIGDWKDPIDELGTFGDKLREGWQSIVDWASDPNGERANTFNGILDDAGVVPENIPFIEKLKAAITAAWPGVSAALTTLWGQVTSWFDTTVGAGINWLAGLFTGTEANGGNTPIYEAVKALLNGDLYAAIDEVIPGAGTKLKDLIGGDWGTKIGEAFPEISKGLTTLAGKFKEWFENDAIPSFAKSIGYFGGRIGVLIGQAIGAIGGFFTGGGAGDAAGSITAGAQEFGDLVGQGFQEALDDSGVGANGAGKSALEGWADQVLTGITGALGTAALAVGLYKGLTDGLWSGIVGALSVPSWFAGKAMGFATSVAKSVLGYLGLSTTWAGLQSTIMGAISATIATFPLLTIALGAIAVTALVTAIWLTIPDSVKKQLQDGLHGILDSAIGEGAGATLSRSIERDMYTVAREMARVQGNTAGVEYFQGMIDAINGQNDAWLDSIRLPGTLNEMLGGSKFFDLNQDGFSGDAFDFVIDPPDINWDDPVSMANYKTSLQTSLDTLRGLIDMKAPELDPESAKKMWSDYWAYVNQMNAQSAMVDIYANWQATGKTPAMQLAEAGLTLADKAGLGAVLNIAKAILMPNEVVVDTTGATPTVAGDTPPIEVPVSWTFKPSDMMGDFDFNVGNPTGAIGPVLPPGGLPKITAADVVDPAMPTVVAGTLAEANTVIDEGMTNFGITAAAQLNNGNLDAEGIKTKFLDPLTAYWTTAFAPEGSMAVAAKTFSANFVTNMSDMGTSLTGLNTAITDQLTLASQNVTLKEVDMTKAITTLKNNFLTQLTMLQMGVDSRSGMLVTSLDTIKAAVNSLITAIGNLGTAMAGVEGMSVPTTPVVNGSHANGLYSVPYDGYVAELHEDEMVLTKSQARQYRMNSAALTSNTSSSTTDNSQTVVYVNGAQDVPGLLRELKRQGVKIG